MIPLLQPAVSIVINESFDEENEKETCRLTDIDLSILMTCSKRMNHFWPLTSRVTDPDLFACSDSFKNTDSFINYKH